MYVLRNTQTQGYMTTTGLWNPDIRKAKVNKTTRPAKDAAEMRIGIRAYYFSKVGVNRTLVEAQAHAADYPPAGTYEIVEYISGNVVGVI